VQLEVWTIARAPVSPNTLVSWQLRFNFPTPVSSIGTLTNGTLTNYIPAVVFSGFGSPYQPTRTSATNLLLLRHQLGRDPLAAQCLVQSDHATQRHQFARRLSV